MFDFTVPKKTSAIRAFEKMTDDNGQSGIQYPMLMILWVSARKSDSSGLIFDAYEYGYGLRPHDGDFNDNDYYLVRDNLICKRLEKYLENEYDLSKYRTWDQIKENEDAADFTITYDRTNASEPAEAAARIFEANREVANSANVISVIQDTEGNEIYRFNYSSLKEDLEKAGIDINNISEVQKYVEEKLVSCDSTLKSM